MQARHDCVYKELNCGSGVYSLHCIVVRKDWRGKGVEDRLAAAGKVHAIELGADTVEAYPEPNSKTGVPFSTWNTFGGHESYFTSEGFASEVRAPGYSTRVWRGPGTREK